MNKVCMCCDCGRLEFLYALLSRDMTSSVPPRMQRTRHAHNVRGKSHGSAKPGQQGAK